jgi:hypothetical protein
MTWPEAFASASGPFALAAMVIAMLYFTRKK